MFDNKYSWLGILLVALCSMHQHKVKVFVSLENNNFKRKVRSDDLSTPYNAQAHSGKVVIVTPPSIYRRAGASNLASSRCSY